MRGATALHALDPVFREFSRSPRMAALVRELLGYMRPVPVQSMYIFKVSGQCAGAIALGACPFRLASEIPV